MNRQRAKELLPIIQAFAEGKEIEKRWRPGTTFAEDYGSAWGVQEDSLFLSDLDYEELDFRIKPEPREWWIDTDDGETWLQRTRPHPGCIKVREVLE